MASTRATMVTDVPHHVHATANAGVPVASLVRVALNRMGARSVSGLSPFPRLAGRATAVLSSHVRRRVGKGEVALSFDDGPHPASTPRILDLLAELGVVATFFCVGRNARAHPEIVTRALAEGHRIGSHSLTHPHPAQTALPTLAREYRNGRRAVEEAVGDCVPLFRPPNGYLDARGVVLTRVERLQPWLWTVDPQDWRPGVSVAHVARVAGRADSTDVVLLHDWVESPWAPEALDRSSTIHALPLIVGDLRTRGLRFATLPAT